MNLRIGLLFLITISFHCHSTPQDIQYVNQYQALVSKLGYNPDVFFYDQSSKKEYYHSNNQFYDVASPVGGKTLAIYLHGLGGRGREAMYFAPKLYEYVCSFNFPDVDNPSFMSSNLGGHKDTAIASEIIKYVVNVYKPQTLVLHGVSRGGAVCLRLTGTKEKNGLYRYLNPDIHKKIRALLLDAPLGSVGSVLRYKQSSFFPHTIRNIFARAGSSLLLYGVDHNEIDKDTPLSCVKNINPYIAMFMISTKEDSLVDPRTIYQIARKRIKYHPETKNNTYCYICSTGDHVAAFRVEEQLLTGAINAFYVYYNISDIATYTNEALQTLIKEVHHKDSIAEFLHHMTCTRSKR